MELFARFSVNTIEEYRHMKTGHLTPEEMSVHMDGAEKLPGEKLAHLKGCPDCSRRLEDWRSLGRMARTAKPTVPSDGMWREISRRLETGGTRLPASWFSLFGFPRPLAVGLAGAAVAGLMAVAVIRNTDEIPARVAPQSPKPAGKTAEKSVNPAPAYSPESNEMKKAATESAPITGKAVEPVKARRKASSPGRPMAAKAASDEASMPAPLAAPAAGAMSRSESAGNVLQVFRGTAFILEAGALDSSMPGMVKASGGVVARPSRTGIPFVALIDGLSRTITGEVRGAYAEIIQPGERLLIKTK